LTLMAAKHLRRLLPPRQMAAEPALLRRLWPPRQMELLEGSKWIGQLAALTKIGPWLLRCLWLSKQGPTHSILSAGSGAEQYQATSHELHQ
jgi:hypothetical protein